MTWCEGQAYRSGLSALAMQHLMLTAAMVVLFVCTKAYVNQIRRQQARCTVVIIGAGPVGLTSVLIASRNPHVERIILYEEESRHALVNKAHQIAFDRNTLKFLKGLNVDFDNMEGSTEKGIFYTRIGIFLEHLFNRLARLPVPLHLHMDTKFTRERVQEVEGVKGRKVVLACDGSTGEAARLLGLSDEFEQTSCRAFGAVASMDRADQCSVPMPERRYHGLVFDLSAYGIDTSEMTDTSPGFTLKLFGSSRHRYMSLAIPKSESLLVKNMRLILDRSMMRNIFIKCFNTCRASSEKEVSETWALRHMKFSPRLFDIKLFQRRETVAYFEDADMFVLAEGEAARCYNIHTGLDVNMALKGLMTLCSLLDMAACAQTEYDVMSAMVMKARHSETTARSYLTKGLTTVLFSSGYS
ncbi:uncharacterized protein LOC143285758 [Babylonia areolata]|uniref:uncharacterized protein LOC143285758 n=1 Tax=Babylonia areolata TaxID=304850 RepID=UPI003FCF5DAD